jgi:hypothetical protein
LASIGRTGGFTARFMPHCHTPPFVFEKPAVSRTSGSFFLVATNQRGTQHRRFALPHASNLIRVETV